MKEQDFGKGAVKQSKLGHLTRRLLRKKLGKAGIPFNWSLGVDNITRFNIPIKNQGTSDSCAGQAGAYAMAIANAVISGTYTDISAKSIYSIIFYPGGGSTEGSIQNIFQKDGALLESELPSYPNTEQNLEDVSWRTADNIKKALTRAGFGKPLTVSISLESFAEAIRDYGFVIMQINGTDNGSWLSPNPKPPMIGTPENEIWSHFMCNGRADTKFVPGMQSSVATQSWGAGVGLEGLQAFTKDYFDSGYIVDAFTAPLLPPRAPQSLTKDANNTILTAQEASYFTSLLAYCSQLISRLFGK